jgi:uncharacterized protein
MVLKSEIEKTFSEQNSRILTDNFIHREQMVSFATVNTHIEIISGVRRCGKSTLMRQFMDQCNERFAFFSFEDSRIFGFEVDDFSKLDEVIGQDTQVYFFDEIQNVNAWEIYVRQLHDRGRKVFITGSNASLLSKELGTRLTGRYLHHELFPFSYAEFLAFGESRQADGSIGNYLIKGGFPEYLQINQPEVLQNLLKDILYRDIAIRYNIKNTGTLFEIALYLLTNVGKPFTYNSLRKTFDIGSANTASDYLTWMEDAYVFYYLQKFSWSSRQSLVNPRKVYAIDNGLIYANTLSFTEDRGRLLENAVFMHLRKKYRSVYYFKEKNECDFVVIENKKCKFLIQVCEEVTGDNKKREINGLSEAMDFFNIKEGYMVTLTQNDILKTQNSTIHIIGLEQFYQTV